MIGRDFYIALNKRDAANNKLLEREVKQTTPLTIALKMIKYLRINLTKEMKDMYFEN